MYAERTQFRNKFDTRDPKIMVRSYTCFASASVSARARRALSTNDSAISKMLRIKVILAVVSAADRVG